MGWWLTIGTSESQNPGGNQSTVYADLYLNWTANQRYENWDTNWSINIGGNVKSSGTYRGYYGSYGVGGSALLGSHSVTYTHNPDGSRDAIGTSGNFSTPTTYSYLPGPLSVGGPTYAAIDYVRLPSAPSSVTAVAVGSVITVTSGEASTPGPTISAYKVSYASSTNGGSTWSSWSSETNMSSRVYAYNSLTPGLTYKFRVRATNVDGDGPFTESNTLFLTAGGKRYTGTNWALTVTAAKRFNGSSFVSLTTAKRYTDDGNWVSLS